MYTREMFLALYYQRLMYAAELKQIPFWTVQTGNYTMTLCLN